MNIKHGEPEQGGDFASSWRELRARHKVARLVFFAGLFSMEIMLVSRPLHILVLLLGCAAALTAIRLSSNFLKSFRCPNCGHVFFDAGSRVGIGPLPEASCAYCELPLDAGEPGA